LVGPEITERQEKAANHAAHHVVFVIPVEAMTPAGAAFSFEAGGNDVQLPRLAADMQDLAQSNAPRQLMDYDIPGDGHPCEDDDHLQLLRISYGPGAAAHGIDDEETAHKDIGPHDI